MNVTTWLIVDFFPPKGIKHFQLHKLSRSYSFHYLTPVRATETLPSFFLSSLDSSLEVTEAACHC